MSVFVDEAPLIKNEEVENIETISVVPPPPYEPVLVIQDKSADSTPLKIIRRRRCACLIVGLAFLLVVTAAMFLLMWFLAHRGRPHHRLFREQCHVIFPEKANIPYGLPYHLREDVEMDKTYAKIHLPEIKNSAFHQQETTILHLFNKNVTVIRKANVCYVKPLRSQLHSLNMDIDMHHRNHHIKIEGHLTNEHWFVSRTAIPAAMFFFTYEYRAMDLCSQVPILRLISRSEYEEGVHRQPFEGESDMEMGKGHHHGHHHHHHGHHHHPHHLPHDKCHDKVCVDEHCPLGFVRRLDVHGCVHECACFPEPGLEAGVIVRGFLCPRLDFDNCPLRCAGGYKRHPVHTCEICECAKATGKIVHRRSVAQEVPMLPIMSEKTCPIVETVFEGVVVGDKRTLAPVNYVHSCEPHEV